MKNAIERLRARLSDGPPETRQQIARQLVPVLRGARAAVEHRLAGIEKSYRGLVEAWTGELVAQDTRPHLDVAARDAVRVFLIAGALGVALDLVVASYVGVLVFVLPGMWAAVVSCLIAVALIAFAEAVFAGLSDRDCPRTTQRRTAAWAVALSVLSIAMVGVIYIQRFSAWSVTALPPTLAVLGLSLPAASGAWFELARERGMGNRLARQYAKADAELEEIRSFLSTVEEQTAWTRRSADRVPMHRGTAAIVLVSLCALEGWSDAAPSRPTRLLVAPDATGSADHVEYRRLLEAVGASLPSIIERLGGGVSVVGLMPWATAIDAWRGPRQMVHLPAQKVPEPAPPGEAAGILRAAREYEAAEYKAQLAETNAEHHVALVTALGPIRKALVGFDPAASAPVSCIDDIVERLLDECSGTVSIVFSDLEPHGCPRSHPDQAGRKNDPAGRTFVVVIVLPGARDGSRVGKRMRERSDRLRNLFPSVRIVPSFEVDDGTAWLSRELETL